MKIPLSILVVLITITTSSSWNLNVDENSVADEIAYRLPETVVPTSYDLSLTIDPAGTTFAGTVIIAFDVNGNVTVNQISLHFDKDYITIKSVKLNNKIGCTAGVPNEASISILKCTGSATGQDNFLNIKYEGKFSTDGYGLVKTSYLDQGKKETVIESVFAPTFARRAFPCFDEPSLRARFSLEINHPDGYSAISNSPVNDALKSGNSTTTTFDVTPKISTHLLSILISKLYSTEVKVDGGCDFRIFTRTDVSNYTSKVLQKYFKDIVDYLGDYYIGFPYQNITEKACYQVALPEYSEKTGGFGVFKYREIDLLDDGEQTTQRTVQDIVTNVAYKLAHEWFGGYLTVSWWSDIWSNEAVATYLAYVAADNVTGNFNIRNQFVLEKMRKLLQIDAYPFAQPLSSSKSDIGDVDSIMKKLNTASYQKGACILRMIQYILYYTQTFMANMAKHLYIRNETATDGSDLIRDLTEDQSTKDEDVNAYLQTWVFSPGFPLVTAKVVNVSENGIKTIKLSQKRFLYPTTDEKVDDKTQWVIPVSIATKEGDFYIYTVQYDVPGRDTYYHSDMNTYWLLNVGSGFFYRVNYDEILWNSIISNLKILQNNTQENRIPDPLSRAQLIDDVFNIARIGEVSYSTAFELADFLENETNYYPWYSAFDAFSYLLGKIGNDVAEENFRVYILRLMNKILRESEKDTSKEQIHVLRRVMVAEWACKLNDTETVKKTVNQFEKNTADPSSLEDPNLRSMIYCNGIRYSGHVLEDTNYLWNIYTNSTSVHEKIDLLNAIGCAENEVLLELYLLKIIMPDSEIKGEDALTVFKSVFSSSVGIAAAKSFLDANITEVVSLGKNVWPEILYTLAERLYTNDDLKWINDKLDNKIFNGYDDIKSKIRTLVAVNNYWANNFQVYVKEIFLRNPTTTTTTTTTIKTTSVVSTTTQRTPTTTDSGSSVVIPNFIASVSVLMLSIIYYTV